MLGRSVGARGGAPIGANGKYRSMKRSSNLLAGVATQSSYAISMARRLEAGCWHDSGSESLIDQLLRPLQPRELLLLCLLMCQLAVAFRLLQ